MATKNKRKKEKAIYISRVPKELWFQLQGMGLEARRKGYVETQREFLINLIAAAVNTEKTHGSEGNGGDGR